MDELKQRIINIYAAIGNEIVNIRLKQAEVQRLTELATKLDKEYGEKLRAASQSQPSATPTPTPTLTPTPIRLAPAPGAPIVQPSGPEAPEAQSPAANESSS